MQSLPFLKNSLTFADPISSFFDRLNFNETILMNPIAIGLGDQVFA
jgi:hypothetical protein